MDKDKKDLMTQMLVEASGDETIEFIRNNIVKLKEYSSILYDEVLLIDPREEDEYIEYYSFYDSVKLAREFIGTVTPEYLESFDKLLVDGSFDLISEPEKEDDDGHVDSEVLDDNTIRMDIHIPLKHNLDDVYAIVHEFYHTTNDNVNETLDRMLFTESVSIFYEFVLYDFLNKKGINKNDNDASLNYRLNSILDDCYSFNYELEELYETICDLDLDYEKHSDEEIEDCYNEIVDSNNYFISSLIALLKYCDYKKGRIKLDQFTEYNESLKRNDNLRSLNYIFIKETSEEDVKEACDLIKEELENKKGMKK